MKKLQRKGLTKKQQLLFRSLQGKFKTCLDKYGEDPQEGYKYLLRLVLAEKIRAVNHIHKFEMKEIPKGIDERYMTYLKGKNATTKSLNRDLQYQRERYATLMEKI